MECLASSFFSRSRAARGRQESQSKGDVNCGRAEEEVGSWTMDCVRGECDGRKKGSRGEWVGGPKGHPSILDGEGWAESDVFSLLLDVGSCVMANSVNPL